MAPSPMLQARLKELERGRAAATTPKSADLEDTILGPLGRRLDAEEKGEGPSSTVELFRVEAPDAPGTVGPAAHEFTTFDAYAGQPPPPPPPDDGIRGAFASPSPAADAKFYADDSDDDEALLAMHTAYQAAARRRPGARDQVWAGSDAVGNPADVLNAALAPATAAESPPAVPTPAGIAASTRPSPVADVGGRPRPAARRRPASEAWPVEARPPVRAPRSPPPSPPVRSRSRTLSDEAAGARAATIDKVPPGAAISPPRAPRAPSPPETTEAASTKTATPRGHRVVTMSRGSSARAPPPAEPAPPSPPPPPSSPLLDPRSPRPDRTPTFARARKLPVAAKRPAAAPAPAPPPPKVARRPPAAAPARPRRASKRDLCAPHARRNTMRRVERFLGVATGARPDAAHLPIKQHKVDVRDHVSNFEHVARVLPAANASRPCVEARRRLDVRRDVAGVDWLGSTPPEDPRAKAHAAAKALMRSPHCKEGGPGWL